MIQKYYYITEAGEKKKYVGNIIKNSDGSLKGMLTTEIRGKEIVDLTYHPEVKEVRGYSSYFTYMNDDGAKTRYYSFHKVDEQGNPYFTYVTMNPISLIYHPVIEACDEYYTYIGESGIEELYMGDVHYDSSTQTYFGKIK